MVARSYPVKQVTRAKLEAHILSLGDLQSLAAPCLNWCHDSIFHAPKKVERSGLLRSAKLEDAARKVFPFSCHTEFNQSLVGAFEQFSELRAKKRRTPRLSHTAVIQELRRPRALLVTDWAASLFDGSLTPETDGFIDDDAMPPWDTWLGLIEVEGSFGLSCLLSWVPCWIAPKVDFAIRADAASCLSWLLVRSDDTFRLNGWGKPWTKRETRAHG